MNPHEFWGLIYYDYQLICLRVLRKSEKDNNLVLTLQALFRKIYHVIYSTAFGQTKRVSERDLWPIEGIDGKQRKSFYDQVMEHEKRYIANGRRLR